MSLFLVLVYLRSIPSFLRSFVRMEKSESSDLDSEREGRILSIFLLFSLDSLHHTINLSLSSIFTGTSLIRNKTLLLLWNSSSIYEFEKIKCFEVRERIDHTLDEQQFWILDCVLEEGRDTLNYQWRIEHPLPFWMRGREEGRGRERGIRGDKERLEMKEELATLITQLSRDPPIEHLIEKGEKEKKHR